MLRRRRWGRDEPTQRLLPVQSQRVNQVEHRPFPFGDLRGGGRGVLRVIGQKIEAYPKSPSHSQGDINARLTLVLLPFGETRGVHANLPSELGLIDPTRLGQVYRLNDQPHVLHK